MASIFDELIQKVDEADRSILQKYPIKQAFDDLEGKYHTAETYVQRWESWKDNEWDETAHMPKSAVTMIRDKENRIAELEATQGTEMNWDEIKLKMDEDMNKRGLISRADLSDEKKLRELGLVKQDSVDNLGYGMQSYYAKTAPLLTSHVREFGEDMDMESFQRFMSSPASPKDEKGMWDFKKGYDQFVTEKRSVKAAEAAVKREEDIRKDEREKTLKERNMGQEGRMPTDQLGSSPEQGWFQRQKMAKLKKDETGLPKLADGPLGTGASAELAYNAWVTSQQGVRTQ